MNPVVEITLDTLIAHLDQGYAEFSSLIQQINLDAPAPTEGEWTPRQVLSHIIGAYYRVPVQAGAFLAGASETPVIFDDPYWMTEWERVPAASFQAALVVAIEGNKALVRSLTLQQLTDCLIEQPPFGAMSLGRFLTICYRRHVLEMHVPQLQAFLKS